VFDIKASTLQVDLITTYTMNDSSTTTSARIACSPETGTLVIAVWHDQTGVLFGRSTDGGTTWSSATQIGDSVTDTDNDNAEIGLYVSGTNQVVTAPNSSIEYGTYLATTAGGSFSKLANSEDNTAPQPLITGDGSTTLYVATDNNGTGSSPDYTVDFDSGYGSFSTSAFNFTNKTETASGNSGNALGAEDYATTTVQNNGTPYLLTTITGLGTEDVSRVEADIYYDVDWEANYDDSREISWELRVVGKLTAGTLVDDEYTTISSDSVTGIGQLYSFSNNASWQTVGIDFSPAMGNVGTVQVYFRANSTGTGNAPVAQNSGANSFRMDNIKIYTSGGSAVDPVLYKVSTYTATDSWSDITPATDSIPKLPYGLGVDLADTDNIELASTDDSTPKWFSSANTGTAYTDNGASDFRVLKRVGNVIFNGGDDSLGVSIDGGTSFEDKRGNIDTVLSGGIGVIKQLLVFV
jgi:hypothetical protein